MTKELEKKICADYVVLREDYSAKDSKAMLATDYDIDIDEVNAIIAREVSRRKKSRTQSLRNGSEMNGKLLQKMCWLKRKAWL